MNHLEAMKAKRAQIMADAAGLRRYPGTGYHDNDPLGPVKHPDPVGRRDARIDEHLVAFRFPFEFILISPDAERAEKAVGEYYVAHTELLLQSRLDQEQRTLIETAKEYSFKPLADGCFVIRAQQFNDVLAILHFLDIGVTTTAV